MEEVDKIIIDSLRHLNCDIDEEIASLKQFSPEIVVAAISTCLETINPEMKLPKKLPPSMSGKIKFASSLAQQIKEFGFKGDMGYQTILYCNEVEVRRVLMFLMEHLPKDSNQAVSIEPLGYVPRIMKQIEDSLKQSLGKMWLPTGVLFYSHSFGKSCPVDAVNLVIPNESNEATYIPSVTHQCSSRQLIPSLLYKDLSFSNAPNWKQVISEPAVAKDISKEILENIPSVKSPQKNVLEQAANENVLKKTELNRIEVLVSKLSDKKEALVGLQEVVSGYEEQLLKVKSQREDEEKLLKDSIAKVKVKNKTLAVLSNEENKVKLRNLVQKAENRLSELANQWREVQEPLLQERDSLRSSASFETLKHQDEQNKLLNLRKTYKEMVNNFKEKAVLEQNLIKRCKELNNKNNRAAYTKRILEIVGNIKKQNKEIQKILSDTQEVQKDIKTLTGQVDRSFTLSDELIFQDCKQDESARRAYKLLAALREECNGILQAVTDVGQAERELRNLEEQVETEKNKDFRDKLDKIHKDLTEIRKEVQALM